MKTIPLNSTTNHLKYIEILIKFLTIFCSTNLLQFTFVDIIKLWILFQLVSIHNAIRTAFLITYLNLWIVLY